MPLLCAECTAFIPAASLTCTQAMLLPPFAIHISVQLYVVFQNVLRHGNSSTFCVPAIDRGRCRFRARNAPHSFQRLLSPARKRCYFRRLRYIFSYRCTSSFKMFCGTAIVLLFAPPLVIDRGRCRFCARNALYSFQRPLPQAIDAAPVVCATYFRTAVRYLLIILRHGNMAN